MDCRVTLHVVPPFRHVPPVCGATVVGTVPCDVELAVRRVSHRVGSTVTLELDIGAVVTLTYESPAAAAVAYDQLRAPWQQHMCVVQ
jgi:hypothetical protein